MKQIRIRTGAIQTIYSNLIMAGVLLPEEMVDLLAKLDACDDWELGLRLAESNRLFNMALEITANRNKN